MDEGGPKNDLISAQQTQNRGLQQTYRPSIEVKTNLNKKSGQESPVAPSECREGNRREDGPKNDAVRNEARQPLPAAAQGVHDHGLPDLQEHPQDG
jgi:hypothetical protein